MLKVVTEHDVKPEQVRAVRLRAGSNILEPLRYKTAKTELEAKFCIPFLLSSILLRRKAGIREFTDEFVSSDAGAGDDAARRRRCSIRRSRRRASTRSAASWKSISTDGRTFVQASDDRYRGGPDRPFTREELHAKFTDCAQLTMPPERMAKALAAIEGVQEMKSIRELVAALA